MSNTAKIKVHFRDTWKDVDTGNVLNVEYSTETVHADDMRTAKAQAQKLKETEGVSIFEGVEHTRECINVDVITENVTALSKEQMFDFILNHTVSITPDNTLWTKTDGTKVRNKYKVIIDGINYQGYDLVDAINEHTNKSRGY